MSDTKGNKTNETYHHRIYSPLSHLKIWKPQTEVRFDNNLAYPPVQKSEVFLPRKSASSKCT